MIVKNERKYRFVGIYVALKVVTFVPTIHFFNIKLFMLIIFCTIEVEYLYLAGAFRNVYYILVVLVGN